MLSTHDDQNIRVLTMEHGKVNALDTEFCHALADATLDFAQSDARALVLTGAGRAFSAGVDLKRLLEGGKDYAEAFLPALCRCLEVLFSVSKPVVASINGHAIAGGCIIACAADRRIAAKGFGMMGVPELKVGVPFPSIALEIMRQSVPAAVETIVYGAENHNDEACLRMGLVDRLVDPASLMDAAQEEAKRLAQTPSASFAITKNLLRSPALHRVHQAAELDEEAARSWHAPEILAFVKNYLEATLKKK